MYLIKHLVHPGNIAKHKSWDKPTKTAKLSEYNKIYMYKSTLSKVLSFYNLQYVYL